MNKINSENQQLATLRKRRSTVSFTGQAVPKDVLVKLVEYATLAPSAGNRQAWRFVIVNDSSLIKTLVDKGGSISIGKSVSGVLVTYENYALTPDYHDDFQTAAACIQNLLLAAQAYGLGACWVSTLPTKSTLRKLFKIPWYYSPIAYVVVGYSSSMEQRYVPRKNNLNDIVAENTFPMKGLGQNPSRIGTYLKRLLACIYRKLPITLQRKLRK